MTEQPQPTEAAFFTNIRGWGLVRGADGIVGGVVSGLGARVGLAPVPARIVVVLGWILLPGLVMLGYAAAWGLLPDRKGAIIIQNFGRGVTDVGALIGIALLTLFSFGALDSGPAFNFFGGGDTYWPWDRFGLSGDVWSVLWVLFFGVLFLALLGAVVVLIVWLSRRSSDPTAPSSESGYGSSADAPVTFPSNGAAASAPVSTPRPVVPRVVLPSIPGPGPGAYLAFVAVMLISAAAATHMTRNSQLGVNPLLAWGAGVTVGLGVILVVVALLGRKLGFLGFMSIAAIVLGLVLAGNAPQFRDQWSGADSVAAPHEDEYEDSMSDFSPIDLTADLVGDYATVMIAGGCVAPSDSPSWEELHDYGEVTATMRLEAVADDIALDTVAPNTKLAIPAGTSLEVTGAGNTTVVWEGRDASCTMWSDPEYDEYGSVIESTRPVLVMTNPDTPTLTINAGTDSTIYLEEVVR